MPSGYFDCFAGVAGDMILGALCDAGLPFAHLTRELKKLPIRGYGLARETARRGALGGTKIDVRAHFHDGAHGERSYRSIHRLIGQSRLARPIRALAQEIFYRLARAEARAHRIPVDRVHFHEVGAVDSIVDIVGAAIGFHYFRFQTIVVSPLPITRGFVRTAHGRYPVPPPAVLELIKDAAIVPSPVRGEIVTPTGAAVLTTVAGAFGECPLRAVTRIGYGVGDKHFRSIPNVLRLLIGEGAPVVAIESNIDDANPQIYDYLIDELLRVGALDVVVRPILMKKRRPAAQVQILCEELKREALIRCLLRETTGFGVRWYPVQRRMLAREERMARTRHGPVRVKLGFSGLHPGEGELLQVSPEYEDCKRVARAKGIPLREIYRLAVAAAVR